MSEYTHFHRANFSHTKLALSGSVMHALQKSLATARVDMNHQVDAALFALQSPLSKGVMLADEVGLGKTIEASLVIAQKWAEQKTTHSFGGPSFIEKAMVSQDGWRSSRCLAVFWMRRLTKNLRILAKDAHSIQPKK